MRYAIVTTGTDSVSVEVYGPKSLSAAFDFAQAFARNEKKFHNGWTKVMSLVNVTTGKVLKAWDVNQETVDLSSIKLTDAMRKALESAQETGVLAQGRSNTLKALEERGLVAVAKSGAAKLTSLGRQYRAQKKG